MKRADRLRTVTQPVSPHLGQTPPASLTAFGFESESERGRDSDRDSKGERGVKERERAERRREKEGRTGAREDRERGGKERETGGRERSETEDREIERQGEHQRVSFSAERGPVTERRRCSCGAGEGRSRGHARPHGAGAASRSCATPAAPAGRRSSATASTAASPEGGDRCFRKCVGTLPNSGQQHNTTYKWIKHFSISEGTENSTCSTLADAGILANSFFKFHLTPVWNVQSSAAAAVFMRCTPLPIRKSAAIHSSQTRGVAICFLCIPKTKAKFAYSGVGGRLFVCCLDCNLWVPDRPAGVSSDG